MISYAYYPNDQRRTPTSMNLPDVLDFFSIFQALAKSICGSHNKLIIPAFLQFNSNLSIQWIFNCVYWVPFSWCTIITHSSLVHSVHSDGCSIVLGLIPFNGYFNFLRFCRQAYNFRCCWDALIEKRYEQGQILNCV